MSMKYVRAQTELIKDLLFDGHPVTIGFSGSSMFPLIRDGDDVVIENAAPSRLRPGDIVSYQQGKRLITHVLHSSFPIGRRRLLFCKGLTNNYGDMPVFSDRVVGRVTKIRRGGKTIVPEPVPVESGLPLPWRYTVFLHLKKKLARAGARVSQKIL